MKWSLTSQIIQCLKHVSECSDLSQSEHDSWKALFKEAEDIGIEHLTLVELSKHLRSCSHWNKASSCVWIHEMIAGSSPMIAPPPVPPREMDSESKMKLRERLQSVINERQYKKMVSNVVTFPSTPQSAQAAAVEAKAVREQLFLAVNILIAMAVCFVCGFYLGNRMFGTKEAGYICGVTGLIIALFVEATLLVINLTKQESHETKMRNISPLSLQSRKVIQPDLSPIPIPTISQSNNDSPKSKKTN